MKQEREMADKNSKNKTNLKLIGVLLFLALSNGCTSPNKLKHYDGIYQVKQIPISDFRSNYVICRNCIEFTSFVSVMHGKQEKPTLNNDGEENYDKR